MQLYHLVYLKNLLKSILFIRMEINPNIITWDFDMGMESPVFHDQYPYDFPYQNCPAQTPQPPSSTHQPSSNFLNQREETQDEDAAEGEEEELSAMKEMMYKIAAMQPVDIDPATLHKPKRRNVRISDDPQSVAARHRRERISQRIRILQRLVPGGTKMDTASMLDEAIRYVKFLKRQVQKLQSHQPQPAMGSATHLDDGNWPSSIPHNILGSSSNNSIVP